MSQRALLILAALLASAPAAGKDVYKHFMDPVIPHHRAVIETLKQLDASPNDAGLHNDLGCLIAWDGFWRDALREFDRAAELAPNDSRPMFNAGLVKATRSEWHGARRSFKAATKRDPGNWPAWWMLGYAEEQLGNTSSAVDAYKTSLRVDTSLFSVKVNPFAASTRLRARVLLETYEARKMRAGVPFANQIASPERLVTFFQQVKPVAPVSAAAVPSHEEEGSKSGPVVTSVTPSSGAAAPRRAFEPPAGPVGRTGVQLVPDAGSRRRDRRLTESPPEPAAEPAAAPAPGGSAPLPGGWPGGQAPPPQTQQPTPVSPAAPPGPGGG